VPSQTARLSLIMLSFSKEQPLARSISHARTRSILAAGSCDESASARNSATVQGGTRTAVDRGLPPVARSAASPSDAIKNSKATSSQFLPKVGIFSLNCFR